MCVEGPEREKSGGEVQNGTGLKEIGNKNVDPPTYKREQMMVEEVLVEEKISVEVLMSSETWTKCRVAFKLQLSLLLC